VSILVSKFGAEVGTWDGCCTIPLLKVPGFLGLLVPAKGLEPPTSRLQGGCSTVELRRRIDNLAPDAGRRNRRRDRPGLLLKYRAHRAPGKRR
jgi:hypothetical protein